MFNQSINYVIRSNIFYSNRLDNNHGVFKKMYDDMGRILKKPSDEAKIWRYMNVPELVSILDKRQLYFSNTSKVIDPYEGTLAEYNKQHTVRLQKFAAELSDVEDEVIRSLILAPPEISLQLYKDRFLINCWHLAFSDEEGILNY